MKKVTKRLVAMLLMTSMMLLQGCALTEPETSHLVKVRDDGKALVAELKASTDDGYEWQYVLDGSTYSEASVDYKNNIFSNTYETDYEFISAGLGTGTLYLILVKNGDYDSAKVFSYMLSATNDNIITIDKEGSYLLASDIKLYNRVTKDK